MVPKEPLFSKLAGLEAYAMPAIVALVAVAAFGLGRLSAASGQPVALRVIYPDGVPAQPAASAAAVTQALPAPVGQGAGAYVASKNGTKYYLATCSGAGRIKPENKVYFVSAEAAKASGYEPAANCPGL